MKKRSLLFALLIALIAPFAAQAQETVTIGDGTSTDYYTPIGTYYNYSITEQLYTADEIGMAGTINSISFNYASTIAKDFPITVYMANVDAENLSTGISLADAEVVFEGTYSVTGEGWMTITLDTPFAYDGTSNLLIGINKDYVYWFSGNWNHTATEAVMARYSNNDNSAYTTTTVPASTSTSRPNIQINITPGSVVICNKPETLVIENVTTDAATLTWTGGSGVYNIELNGTIIEEDYEGNTYNLTELSPATAYTVKVQSVCDDATSGWKSVSFTTECDIIPALGYTESFDSYTAGNNVLPNCWSYINTTTNSTYAVYPRVYANGYSTYANSAPNCLYFYSYGSSDPQPQYAILPEMTGLAGLQVTLMAKGYNASSTLKIGTMSDPTDASTFTMIAEQTLTTSYPTEPFEFIIPANCSDSYLAIMMDAAPSGYNTRGVYVDDITIAEVPTCLKPTELAVTGVSTTTATLGWTNGADDQTAWQIMLNGNETNLIMANSNPFTIEDLTAATSYTAKVRAYCGADDQSDWSNEVSFTTACEAITDLPWNENFDAYTGSTSSSAPTGYPNDEMPNCWQFLNRSNNTSTYPQVFISSNSGYPVSGNCLFFRSSSTTPLYAILPAFEEEIAALQLTFTYRNEGTSDSNGTLIVGYMTNPADATTFTPVLTCERTTTLTEKEVLFPEAPTGSYIAFMYQGGTSNNYYLSIDNVSVDYIPTCAKPTDLTFVSATTTTATLSWTSGANETAWQIMLNDDEENLIMAENNQWVIEGLTASTAYTAKVRAYCSADDQSDWSNEVSFATLCEAITTFPWSEDFNSLTAGIPDCWDNSEGTTTTGTYKWNYYATGHDGAGLRFNSYNNSNGLTNFLKTVSLSLPSDQLMQLSFWYKNPTGGDFSVYISTDGGATHETALATGLTGVSTWTELVISLADYAGQEVVIVFKGTSNYGSGDAYIYLDDVTVMEVPTCLKPNGLEVTATTTTTATLSWTAGANETAWQICLNGDETNLIMAESNPFTVEGLTASTSYTAKVRAYCNADDQSDWSNEVSFATECEAIVVDAANPFTEGFDGDWTPLCWESIPYVSGTTTRQWTKTTTSSNIHTGAGAAYSGYYGPIYLVMPDLQLGTDGDAVQLTFWSYNSYVNDYDKNSVVLLDGENEIELWSPESVNSSWEETTIDLTEYMGQTISLAFKYEGDNAHGWYVDDVRVGAPASTYALTIEGYEDDNNESGYYLIASPVTVDLTNHEMTTGDFDLYAFDQAQDDEWRNYKQNAFSLEPGKGYLYAHKTGGEFTLTGTAYSGDGEIELVYDDNAVDFKGWNLVGNPWGVKAYTNKDFYTMNNDGSGVDVTVQTAGTEIASMTGIFVVAEGEDETVTFATENPGKTVARLNLNITRNSSLIDRAIVRFSEGSQLPKFQLNPNHTKIYMSVDGKDYAIVNATEMGEMPVSFKAESDGNYTLSVNAEEVSFAYLHLIDNMTGIETDLLANPSYSFEASTTDYANRFKLVFATGNADDTFAFFSNGSFVINNEGIATVQVIDVNGRIISSESINGCANVNVKAAAGVYMIRLVNGDNVKVQKVVVK